jgi:hypothetical protein
MSKVPSPLHAHGMTCASTIHSVLSSSRDNCVKTSAVSASPQSVASPIASRAMVPNVAMAGWPRPEHHLAPHGVRLHPVQSAPGPASDPRSRARAGCVHCRTQQRVARGAAAASVPKRPRCRRPAPVTSPLPNRESLQICACHPRCSHRRAGQHVGSGSIEVPTSDPRATGLRTIRVGAHPSTAQPVEGRTAHEQRDRLDGAVTPTPTFNATAPILQERPTTLRPHHDQERHTTLDVAIPLRLLVNSR